MPSTSTAPAAPARLDFSALPIPPQDRRVLAPPSIAPFTVAGLIGYWTRRSEGAPEGDPLGGHAEADPYDRLRASAGFIAGCAVQALPPTNFDGDHPSYMLATLAVTRVAVEKLSAAADMLDRLTNDLFDELDKLTPTAGTDLALIRLRAAIGTASDVSLAATDLSVYAHGLGQMLESSPGEPV